MTLADTIAKLAQKQKGILAADESQPTIKKRFDSIQIESTEETRQAYRDVLLSAPTLEHFISGVILFEETLMQQDNHGTPFPQSLLARGIMPGIKVDKGLTPCPLRGEKITQGLDGLPGRLETYKEHGAVFCKWRAVYQISENTPSDAIIQANAQGLALYAAMCQEAEMVPIVEPEVLMDGDHNLATTKAVTERVLEAVFTNLDTFGVTLEHIVLKPSMVIHGIKCSEKASIDQVAEATLSTLQKCVPQTVPTINFLSGGQTPDDATAHLKVMNQLALATDNRWQLSFSYGRALQEDCLKTWQGKEENVVAARAALLKRSEDNANAMKG